MKVDMSPEAVTQRLRIMDDLWVLSVKLMKSKRIITTRDFDQAVYWKNIVAKLLTESNWASHVLSTCIDEEDSNLDQALKYVPLDKVIGNTIMAYEDWSAQPYCDEILSQFNKLKILAIYERIENPSKNVEKGMSRFLSL